MKIEEFMTFTTELVKNLKTENNKMHDGQGEKGDHIAERYAYGQHKLEELRLLLKPRASYEILKNSQILNEQEPFDTSQSIVEQLTRFASFYESLAPDFEEARKSMWCGDWKFNFGGQEGLLIIIKPQSYVPDYETPVLIRLKDCFNLDYGRVASIDPEWKHIIFGARFAGESYAFKSIIFKWDPSKMAGLAYVHSLELAEHSFFATKVSDVPTI